MTKKVLSIAITLPILLGIGLFGMLYTQHISESYQLKVRQVETLAREGDMEGAQKLLTEVAVGWEKRLTLMQLWICHSDTDNVGTQLRGLQVGLTIGDRPSIFLSSANLIEALRHLHHRDDLSISNIL